MKVKEKSFNADREIICVIVSGEEEAYKVGEYLSSGYEVLSVAGCARFIVYHLHRNKP